MADRYDGTAELLDGAGSVIDTVRVYLQKQGGDGGLISWAGHIEPTTFEGGHWDQVKRVRLRDGSEGDVIITKENIRSDDRGTTREGQIQGSGTAPF